MTRSEMRRLYEEQKLSTQDIGQMAGKSKATIAYHLHEMGVKMRDRKQAAELCKHYIWTEEKTQKLRDMWPANLITHIARELKVSKGAIFGKADRLGLPPRRPSYQQRTTVLSQVAMSFESRPYRHRSLISFLPESPKLEMAFRAEVAKAHEMRQWI
jgi:GcrA cell cycle regulator